MQCFSTGTVQWTGEIFPQTSNHISRRCLMSPPKLCHRLPAAAEKHCASTHIGFSSKKKNKSDSKALSLLFGPIFCLYHSFMLVFVRLIMWRDDLSNLDPFALECTDPITKQGKSLGLIPLKNAKGIGHERVSPKPGEAIPHRRWEWEADADI